MLGRYSAGTFANKENRDCFVSSMDLMLLSIEAARLAAIAKRRACIAGLN
nr:MAG TPA: hypothetical protein [Caudoviricetes sp.]